MSTKIGPINQHQYLHPQYGKDDCCLCKSEERIKQLEQELSEAKKEIERLSSRDGNSKIQLAFNDGVNPFTREDLKVVDFGVSDNIYVVESQQLSTYREMLEKMCESIKSLLRHFICVKGTTSYDAKMEAYSALEEYQNLKKGAGK